MSTTPWIYPLEIDLSQKFSMDEIEVKLLDVITLDMQIYDEGSILDLSNCAIALQAQLSNNTTYIQTNFGITKSGNRLVIECTDRLTQVGGLVKIEIKFLFSNNTRPITSRWIYMYVENSAISINRDTTQSTLTATEFINNLVNELASLQVNLTNEINQANQAILNLQTEESISVTKISNIQTAITNAENEIININAVITNATSAKTGLQNSINQAIADVNSVITSATTAKNSLQSVVTTAQQTKIDLLNINTLSQTTKTELQNKINDANNTKIALQNFDPTGLVANTNILLNQIYANQLLLSLNHGLNGYPNFQLVWTEFGAGVGGVGVFPVSANSLCDNIASRIVYVDNNNVNIYVPQSYYIANSVPIKISNYKYIINFTNSTKSLLIQIRE